MANFLVTTVSGTLNSKKNNIINTFKNTPYYDLIDDGTTWKKDKISSRLSDLSVQKSGYNEIIPHVYGNARLAGNIIWATDIKEVKKTYRTSYSTGKNSKSYQTTIEYYYYANVAIGICAGEITEIKKVWADTDLINLSDYTYRLYYGTENQSCDSFIESIEGIGNTPAYRGLCYIVFENLPLTEFGNRIPNFTFEVNRSFIVEEDAENLIGGVNMIPGCGEFVYDTKVIAKQEGTIWYNQWFPLDEVMRINQNNNSGIADAVVSINQLKNTLPNCNWVSPVVVWFGDSLNIASCKIEPRVEFKLNPAYPTSVTLPEDWSVAGISRANANLISNDNGSLRYGGTVSDTSILRYIKYLKEQGYNVMFYPMMFMDIANKPWRGYLTGNASDVNSFFTKSKGYNEFILHYANLVKDYVDAFIIGSELIGLTKIYTTDGTTRTYPAVNCFISLAESVKNILGSNVKISYAGDWSEYHHTDDGWYNMDKLWASPNIDFIGIDAYFPLTDKKEGLITKQDIIEGWTSGEGYDWIYTDNDRITKTAIESKYAWKNIEWWWKNQHINPDSTSTEWMPQSKKIWFTEYGFASVDGTSNEPNKFYDPKSVDGGFPRFSEGKINYFSQRKGIQATEEVWKNSNMIEKKFVWAWDARPYPFFPNFLNTWSDGSIWYYGHWINGKLGTLTFSNIIKNIFNDAEIDYSIVGDIDIYDSIDGMVLNNIVSVNEVLSILQKVFFFDYFEKDGKLYIVSKQDKSSLEIDENELIELEKGTYFKSNIIAENDLPYKLNVSYLNKNSNYETCNTYAERVSVNSIKKESESIPVVMTAFKAKQIAEKLLYSSWLERIVYNFKLLPKYIYLNPSDVITLNINNTNIILRIASILINEDNTIEVKAVKYDNTLYSFEKEEETYNDVQTAMPTSKTSAQIFELPAINGIVKDIKIPEVFFATNGTEKGWIGCGIYSAKTGSSNFNIIEESSTNSIVGTCINTLGNARPYYFDYGNELYVIFGSNIDTNVLSSADLFDLLDGSNIALVGNEVIQFKNIELQSDGTFKLSQLLRGRYGTESYINMHSSNEKFIFLNSGLISKQYNFNDIGTSYDYKLITFKDSYTNSTDITLKINGRNLIPLPVCHIKVNNLENGDYKITWVDRKLEERMWKDGEETISQKTYLVSILNNLGNIIRNIKIENSLEWVYTNTMITADGNPNNWSVKINEHQQ